MYNLKSLFKWPMVPTLSLESDKEVMVGKTLKHLTKVLDGLEGIGHRYNEDIESKIVVVLANGMVHKLKEQSKNDGV